MPTYFGVLSSQGVATTLTNDLVAYYSLDVDGSDSSGNGNDGTINGATLVTGKINDCRSFDGVNDLVSIPKVFASIIDSNFSVSGWFNVSSFPGSGVEELLSFRGERNLEFRFDTSNLFNFKIFTGSVEISLQSSALTTSTWYHFVATRSTTEGMKLYINGSESDTNAYTGAIASSALTNNAFGELGNNSLFFHGLTDEVGIWSRVLTTDEVTELYNGGAGNNFLN